MDKEKFSSFFDGKAINCVARDAVMTTSICFLRKEKSLEKNLKAMAERGGFEPRPHVVSSVSSKEYLAG